MALSIWANSQCQQRKAPNNICHFVARRLEAVLIVERLGSGRARLAICGEDHQRLRADDVELNVRAARNFEFDVRAARDSHRLDGASFARSFVIQ